MDQVLYPSDPKKGPTSKKIEKLKQMISEIIPDYFSKDVLDNHYGLLEHPADDTCLYSSHELDGEMYQVETYGLIMEDMPNHD